MFRISIKFNMQLIQEKAILCCSCSALEVEFLKIPVKGFIVCKVTNLKIKIPSLVVFKVFICSIRTETSKLNTW